MTSDYDGRSIGTDVLTLLMCVYLSGLLLVVIKQLNNSTCIGVWLINGCVQFNLAIDFLTSLENSQSHNNNISECHKSYPLYGTSSGFFIKTTLVDYYLIQELALLEIVYRMECGATSITHHAL